MNRAIILAAVFLNFLYLNFSQAQVVINEILSTNSSSIMDEDGDYSDWIELYNNSNQEIQLEGWFLSDDIDIWNLWEFPTVSIAPKSHLLIWASGKDKIGQNGELHTNFKIDKSGENLSLFTSDGSIIDEIYVVPLNSDQSYARIPDGSDFWHVTNLATPNNPNKRDEESGALYFSKMGGIYSAPFDLELTTDIAGAVIMYTLDGSEPSPDNVDGKTYVYKDSYREHFIDRQGELLEGTYQSHLYQSPLHIQDRTEEENKISLIATTYHKKPSYFPNYQVDKATIVRARSFKDGTPVSDVITNTYFIGKSFESNEVSIISLGANDTSMFEYYNGIMIPGIDYENWRTKWPLDPPRNFKSDANYKRKGRENERPMSFELFNPMQNNKELTQDIGFRVHGAFSRIKQQKSLRLYARNDYGTSKFKYDFFSEDDKKSYKRLTLKMLNPFTIANSIFLAMVNHLDLDALSEKRSIVYLNGEYYGMYDLSERVDKHFFERKYGAETDAIDFLENNRMIKEGGNGDYMRMIDFASKNNLSNQNSYQRVEEQMDIENYIDYQVSEIFSGNTDWPVNNVLYWRYNKEKPEDGHAKLDGKWRWILYDLDYAFGTNDDNDCTLNTLEMAAKSSGGWSTLLLSRLLMNEGFKLKFINRFADLLNTTFLSERLLEVTQDKVSPIAPYFEDHLKRWPEKKDFNEMVNVIETYVQCRPTQVFNHVEDFFNLEGKLQLTLDIDDHAQAHYIQINTIEINDKTVGVESQPYPWSGTYFKNIAVTLTAVPAPGYEFSHWEGVPAGTPQAFEFIPQSNSTLTAHFTKSDVESYQLVYESTTGGYLVGDSVQTVLEGESGTAVEAVALEGFTFIGWSDGVLDNPRTDVNVQSNLEVQALFEKDIINYQLVYQSSEGGYLVGDSVQTVMQGESGTAVEAVPYSDYIFTEWSDGQTQNPRIDQAVSGDLEVYAIFNNIATSIQTKSSSISKVYPNPTSSQLNLSMKNGGAFKYSIYDIKGQLIQEGSWTGMSGILYLNKIASGMYVGTVTDEDNKTSHFKFIKE